MFKTVTISILFYIFGPGSECLILRYNQGLLYELHNRTVRHTSTCKTKEVSCNSGECISKYSVCDGIVDCKDGSDETVGMCSQLECADNTFRCSYGACVDGSAKCNGINDCADKSDEIRCPVTSVIAPKTHKCGRKFTCDNGQCIDSTRICDGTADCSDSSDETVTVCHDFPCVNAFQCQYGACVENDAKCNGVYDCFDGSDENLPECSNRNLQKTCILPGGPENGYYKVNNDSYVKPGSVVPLRTVLVFYCDAGYKRTGDKTIFCVSANTWTFRETPKCLKTCPPNFDISLKLECTLNGKKINCHEPAVENTTVYAQCKEYYFFRISGNIDLEENGKTRCINGEWQPSTALMKCVAECGRKRVKTGMEPFIYGGRNVTDNRKYPWHVGLYKRSIILKQIKWINECGGAIIRSNIVLTAAHCFTNPPNSERYAVGAGKIFKKWNATDDTDAQYIYVKKIQIPQSYEGDARSYAHDIAVVTLRDHFRFNKFVMPICIDWTRKITLTAEVTGSVAGWGLTRNGEQSPILKDIDLPFKPFSECRRTLKDYLKLYQTDDKMCAGRPDGQTLCKGDSGGAYAVLNPEDNLYYAMGIVSVGKRLLTNDQQIICDTEVYTLFTNVSYHTQFLKSCIR